jgi:hypothetical protein
MSVKLTALAVAAAALLSACATGPGGNHYAMEYNNLNRDCRSRGGILAPLANTPTGNPGADYACRIHGGGTHLQPRSS